jgi:hypothetical protein
MGGEQEQEGQAGPSTVNDKPPLLFQAIQKAIKSLPEEVQSHELVSPLSDALQRINSAPSVPKPLADMDKMVATPFVILPQLVPWPREDRMPEGSDAQAGPELFGVLYPGTVHHDPAVLYQVVPYPARQYAPGPATTEPLQEGLYQLVPHPEGSKQTFCSQCGRRLA